MKPIIVPIEIQQSGKVQRKRIKTLKEYKDKGRHDGTHSDVTNWQRQRGAHRFEYTNSGRLNNTGRHR